MNEECNAISPATDDGIRGHIKIEGAKYRDIMYTVYLQRAFKISGVLGKFHLTGHLPFRDMKITGINLVDQTKDVTSEDLLVKSNLTDE